MMQVKTKKVIVLLLGWAFIVLGVMGLFLPVLQGMLFLVIGLTILSSEYVWAHHLLQRARSRFPTVASLCDKASDKAHIWMRKISGPQTTAHCNMQRDDSQCAEAQSAEQCANTDSRLGTPR